MRGTRVDLREQGKQVAENCFILYLLAGIVCFLGFFCRLGAYPLLDIDETRYVDMAREMFHTKDFMTLYLNGEFFFEKPPLFFWIECLSFKLSGVVSELTARLPLVILSLLPAGLLLFLCKKVKGDRFAVITTTTLFTCLEYIFLTKIAILDTVFTSFVVSSILCYFYTFYAKDKNKKYFWALTYIFSALAVLAKGIPGAAIPALVVMVSSAVFKTYKETLKYSPMVLLFFVLIVKCFEVKNFKFKDKFLTLNVIAALTTLIFFSLSGGKLVTYILPVYPFAALIIGTIWLNYIKYNDKAVNISLVVFNSLLILSAVVLAFIHTVGPVWNGRNKQERELLKSCYYTALELARENNIKTIAFPSVSCGVYRFPIEEACQIAISTVKEYLNNYDGFEKVIFINPSEDIVEIYKKNLANY